VLNIAEFPMSRVDWERMIPAYRLSKSSGGMRTNGIDKSSESRVSFDEWRAADLVDGQSTRGLVIHCCRIDFSLLPSFFATIAIIGCEFRIHNHRATRAPHCRILRRCRERGIFSKIIILAQWRPSTPPIAHCPQPHGPSSEQTRH
jgi:hypothetical protein